jgi:hypothetical protein
MEQSSPTGKIFTKTSMKVLSLITVSLWLAHPGPSFAGSVNSSQNHQ